MPVEFQVCGGAVRLDVDEQLHGFAVAGVHRAVVGPDPGQQRVQVERRKGAGGVEVGGFVGDEQLPVHEEDVRLDAGEPVGESVVEWVRVEVVVVRVGLSQRA